MERIVILCKLGFKYLYRYQRRYAFLLAALVFCFGIVTFITSTKDRMYDNLYYTAQSHYAGDVVAVGYNRNINITHHLGKEEIESLNSAAENSGINPSRILKRTLFMNTGVVYHNGISVIQKYIIGCDWKNEEYLFSKMDFSSPVNIALQDDSIVVSDPVAKQLNAKIGDIVTLEVSNNWGQKNTGQFIVSGIVQDSTIFGYYKVYVSRLTLNRLLFFDDGDCSVMGFFFEDSSSAEENRTRLHVYLAPKAQVGPLVHDRDGMNRELAEPWAWKDTKIFLFTLPVYLSEIANLLNALDLLTYLLYGMMLIIIFASAAVTYRLIMHERTREMGVMRAIGFFGGDLRMVLWTEVFILGIISVFAGFLLSIIFSIAASFISFDWFPSFEIFLSGGKLTALYLPKTIINNIILTLLILAAAIILPSVRASNKNLPSLLSGEPL